MTKFPFKIVIFFIVICFSLKSGFAQIDQKKLVELRSKYPWGSIYITYISFINLGSILEDKEKFKYISTKYPNSSLSTLQSFMNRYKSPSSSQAIAFIQIDLNRIQAGFKRASDVGGEITSIAWNKEDVVNIADLCDKQLNAMYFVKNTLSSLTDETTTLTLALNKVTSVKENAFASAESYFIVAKDLRLLLSKQKGDSGLLKVPDSTRLAIVRFKNEFDNNYIKLKNFHASKKLRSEKAKKDTLMFLNNMIGLEKNLKENSQKIKNY